MSTKHITSAIAAAILLFSVGLAFVSPLGSKWNPPGTYSLVVQGPDATANLATLGTYDVSFVRGKPPTFPPPPRPTPSPPPTAHPASPTFLTPLTHNADAAWIGPIGATPNAEPLLLYGTKQPAFLSVQASSPNGYQHMYVRGNETGPLQFSMPHAFPPRGVVTAGFGFDDADGALGINGEKKFVACPDADAPGSYQIWWCGAGVPKGKGCLVDVKFVKGT